MQDFALEVEPQQCLAFSERRACLCVDVDVGVWGNGIERRPPFSRPPICRPPFVCVVGAARLSRPPSAEIVGDGG